MKKALLVLFPFLISCRLTAQEVSDQSKSISHYLLFGAGYLHETIYDEAISSIRYQRGGAFPEFGYLRVTEKAISRYQLNASYLNLRSDQRSDLIASKVSSIEVGFDYDYLHLVKSMDPSWNWYAGARVNLLFDLKQAPQLDNSSLLYDYALNIGPSTALRKYIQWEKRKPSLIFQISLPILSHISRPPYLNRIEFIDVQNELLTDFFDHSEFTSLNGLFRLQTIAEFYYPVKSGNQLRLSYRWDYYRMKTFNRSFQGEQQLIFSFLMNI